MGAQAILCMLLVAGMLTGAIFCFVRAFQVPNEPQEEEDDE